MKKLFQIILMILHCIALIFIAVVNFSRICFYATWPPKDDLILWTFVIFVFFIHYIVLFIGHKLKYISSGFLRVLKIIEITYSCFQLVMVLFLSIITWFNLTLAAVFPTIITTVVALVLRYLMNKNLQS